MTNHVKVGELLDVTFAPAHRGVQTEELLNGRRAFPVDSGPLPLAGDRWQVMVVGINRKRTVYFVEPLHLINAADGMTDVLKDEAPFYHEYIREAESSLRTFFPQMSPSSESGDDSTESGALPVEDDDLVGEILESPLLPQSYLDSAWSRYDESLGRAAE
jgi:hypothetical protein